MADPVAVGAFVFVLAGTSLLAVTARRFRQRDELPSFEGWSLAGRQFGTVITWFLLGGTIFTAYTFAAVPGLAYGVGALGFFALPYTIILCPLLFVLLPKLWQLVQRNGYVTVADYVRGRYSSPSLALIVALTGILATMPYIALQLLGVRAVLTAGGIYPSGVAGDLTLAAAFAVLAFATYRSGLRAPTVISVVKGALIFGSVLGAVLVVLNKVGSPSTIFDAASGELAKYHAPEVSLALDPALYGAFASLALGSALALPMYPHVLTAAFAARSPDTLRRATIALPAWTVVLGLFGLLGIAALAVGVTASPGNAEAAVPLLVQHVMPPLASGVVFGALAVGALVPAAVMSVAVAGLFVRNIYVEYFYPTATTKNQMRVAQVVSLVAKVGALAFVFGLRDQDAINLQLLGGVWMLQTFPTIALGLFTSWFHRGALVAGWVAGMLTGSLLVVSGGFSSVVRVELGGWSIQLYAALVALVVNLAVAAGLTPLLDHYAVPRGRDMTAAT